MKKVKKYRVVSEITLEKLMDEISLMLSDGWDPFGNLVVVVDTGNGKPRFLQPMVLYYQ